MGPRPPAVAVNAVVSADAAGRITQFNPAAERIFGYGREEVIGRPFTSLLAEEHHGAYRLELDRLFSSEEAEAAGRTLESVGRRVDGSAFPLELCLVTWRSGADALFTGIVRDITERVRVENEREELLRRVEAMARTDEVTGLANRRAWDEELRRELARAARQRQPVCVAMLDLDHFKAFNDANGHQAGDALLRDVAAAWRLELRVTDLLARYGGDEFALLLPGCPRELGSAILERLRECLPAGQTCSAGLAYWDGALTAEQLVAQADEALFLAKRTGRNRVAG